MSERKIGVLVVDDTVVARRLLTHILESDPRIRVAGEAGDGQTAVDFVAAHAPDVVLMDIHMPRMDGFEATRLIMESHPLPIVICSGTTNACEVATSFRLMEAGAVACVEKPVSRDHADFARLSMELLQTVKLMSEVKVVRRWSRSRMHPAFASATRAPELNVGPTVSIRAVGIGASTGGPLVLQTLLGGLPKDFAAPVLIVQHIAHGFLPGLVEWLNQTTGLQVQIASYGATPLPGHVYLAPDNFHMGLSASGRIVLTGEEPENGLRPAVSHLFRSLAQMCGASAVGVLLTGMGKDGAAELKLMRDRGAVTIAQDHETSVVHGMPAEAILLSGATHVLPAEKIADCLISLARRRPVAEGLEP